MGHNRAEAGFGPVLLRMLLGALFIAHLYWKFALLPGGLPTWWSGLERSGYPAFVPAYVLSAELAGALLLIPGVMTRYVALFAMPMMAGVAQFWLVRKGFYFTQAGAELPLVWLALLGLQVVLGDGRFASVASPDPRRFLSFPPRPLPGMVPTGESRPKPTLEAPGDSDFWALLLCGRAVPSLAKNRDKRETPMRMFLKVQMEVEAANRAIKDGSLPKIVQGFMGAAKPEGAWFTALDGKRTMVAVFDLASTAKIPPLAEPFFAGLNATFELSPAMDAADLAVGLAAL